ELDGLRHAVQREVADDDEVVAVNGDPRRGEGPGREVLDVEEVGAAQVGVACLVAGGDGRRVDLGGHGRALEVLADDDRAGDAGEVAPNLGDADVTDREAGLAVGGVDRVGTGGQPGG